MVDDLTVYLGPPGTGKTWTLMEIVSKEAKPEPEGYGTPLNKIGYVSFTKQATNVALQRVQEVVGNRRADIPFFSTLHALCFRQLGLNKTQVFSEDHYEALGKAIGAKITGRVSQDGTLVGFEVGDRLLFMDGLARARCTTIKQQHDFDSDGIRWPVVEAFDKTYRVFKQTRGIYDYTDMLEQFLSAGIVIDLDALIVDEAQDLTKLQWQVVDRLAQSAKRMYVAGDDDQAIYNWSGADANHLIQMAAQVGQMDLKKRVVLKYSRRVPAAVHKLALGLTREMGTRAEKEWEPRTLKPGEEVSDANPAVEGEVQRLPLLRQLRTEHGQNTLILARNSYILRQQVQPWLRQQGLLWTEMPHNNWSVRRSDLAAIRTWETLRGGNPARAGEVRNCYRLMSLGKGVARGHKKLDLPDDEELTMEQLAAERGLLTSEPWYKALDEITPDRRTYLQNVLQRIAARQEGGKLTLRALRLEGDEGDDDVEPIRPYIQLGTIHSSKGGEAEHVVVMKEMAWRTFNEMRFAKEDEARVWYVAITRAQQRLTIVESTSRQACPWL